MRSQIFEPQDTGGTGLLELEAPESLCSEISAVNEVEFIRDAVDSAVLTFISQHGPAPAICDFGCGDLRLAEKLAKHLPRASVVGIDLDARFAFRAAPNEKIRVLEGDITQRTELPSKSLTHVVMTWVDSELSPADLVACLGEANRLLVPNGKLLVAATDIELQNAINPFFNRVADNGTRGRDIPETGAVHWKRPAVAFDRAFTEAGFDIVDMIPFPVPPREAVSQFLYMVEPGMNHSLLFIVSKDPRSDV